MRHGFNVLGKTVFILIAVGAFARFVSNQIDYQNTARQLDTAFTPAAAAPTLRQVETTSEATKTAISKPEIQSQVLAVPTQEQALMDIVQRYAAAYNSAPNGMLKGANRPARKKAICKVIRGPSIQNWTGRIDKLSTNNEGKGVMTVRISENITFATNDFDFADEDEHTLIPTDSALFSVASHTMIGQAVTFSGVVFYDSDDCMKEASLTFDGAMTKPEFRMRFTAVSPN